MRTDRPPPPPRSAAARWCVLGGSPNGRLALVELTADGSPISTTQLDAAQLPELVAQQEGAARRDGASPPRWVWADAAAWYPQLLAAGIRVERCHDLRLVHTILRHSRQVTDPGPIRAAQDWDVPVEPPSERPAGGPALFDLDASASPRAGVPQDIDAVLEEFARQQRAIDEARDPARLRLLVAAESAGAVIAAELQAAGIPWDVQEHDRILSSDLGPRPRPGHTPALMAEAAAQVREALGDPLLSIDSPPRLLRALHRAGIDVRSTSRWELAEHEHPAIEPLLRYKKMHRLLTANGWAWMEEWVHEGRYRPVYVPGGVVTGRWASSGGGALQIPRQLRPALRADPGWRLVSADVSQLEPRVLAAMAGDQAMIRAGAGTDLYAGIVAAGVVATRQEAKVGVLGALYGGTTGDSGRIVPRLRRTFPRAMALVDDAARLGEAGGTVSTWLGRSSLPADAAWTSAQQAANLPDASTAEQERARRSARDRGRFTRNFVVQGTAAEWALSWMAGLRLALSRFEEVPEQQAARASGPVFARRAHLAFFLHDEVIVHAPADQAEQAARAIQDAADAAGRLLFPGSGIDFPLDLAITERSAEK
ncbi:bifunctional 3'-5' exonuclease/DNA polymerase [Brachybacterium sp. p3-SID957]|uniref:bifunctional 3'-5' exonuclease/DNA polymerase n=1 Tax=Brachybacterium sp. p3-SID957 TaxID=2916049 RepID=UPI00223AA890|nr:bifunctional 3'-5' exonuclease/DNA polymerase [Brachybacterium sp. p3-SID957]MCT1775401.1 bifunctional 3'-5' exonuclease/DNA polymerase [Brachybacterium sp. p3-SID957]